jgi:phenylacetic acid degradation operon negative regulatory protein
MTLYADYWLSTKGWASSAALVRLLAEFGITEASGRAALSRLSRRGMVTVHRNGRRTFYGVDSTAATTLGDAVRKVMAFGDTAQPWDGTWTTVAFSIPEDQREVRHQLRTRLLPRGWPRDTARALFAEVYDGLGPLAEHRVRQVVHELDPDDVDLVCHHTAHRVP